MNLVTDAIYSKYFNTATDINWESFRSKASDYTTPLSKLPADISVKTEKSWQELAKQISLVIFKIVIFPLFIYALGKYIIQRILMTPIYPAQSRIVKLFVPMLRTSRLDLYRKDVAEKFNKNGNVCRQVVLEKDGNRYSGLLIGTEDKIRNGNWVLQATGNAEPIEHSVEIFFNYYQKMGYNVLCINGPSVGKNEGQATPSEMGDAQQLGILLLETAIKAKKIVIAGRSLGGAAIGQAILKHEFKEDIRYLVVRQMTFDRASNIVGKFARMIVHSRFEYLAALAVTWSGCEMDSVAASKKLQQKKIQEIIIQCSTHEFDPKAPKKEHFQTDGPILFDASLGYTLVEEGITDNKVFIGLTNAGHMTSEAFTAGQKYIQNL
ncbi:MAG: hypothetical protein JSR58_07440 [Verrucomicrobia bacterium]|nr:hypothetical protein [Verrucomicrobiota bacterium]